MHQERVLGSGASTVGVEPIARQLRAKFLAIHCEVNRQCPCRNRCDLSRCHHALLPHPNPPDADGPRRQSGRDDHFRIRRDTVDDGGALSFTDGLNKHTGQRRNLRKRWGP